MIRLAVFVAVLLGLCSAPAQAAPTVPIRHVIVIAMENHARAQVIGSASAPYITGLAHTYGEATNYVNILHPSLPNYLAVTGGTNASVTNDCLPSVSCGSNAGSIFSQTTLHRSYQEGMTQSCMKVPNTATSYAPKHNPEAYYRTLADCPTTDLALPTGVPYLGAAFTFITPSQCHDMHSNSCAGSANVVKQGDDWLKGYLPKLLASARYLAGDTAIFVWWDENAGSGVLPFIVVSPYTHGVVYSSQINHYNTLATIQGLLGKGCLANSCGKPSFAAAFGLQ